MSVLLCVRVHIRSQQARGVICSYAIWGQRRVSLYRPCGVISQEAVTGFIPQDPPHT